MKLVSLQRLAARRENPRQGGVMLLAVIVLTGSAMLTAGMLRISGALIRRQVAEVEELRAFYIAEAGLAEAYLAIHTGKRGQVGSMETPATFDGGLLWVDASFSSDTRMELESTASFGRAAMTLGLVVDRVPEPLGFFADTEVNVESGVIIDGFNSEEGGYVPQIIEPPEPEPLVPGPGGRIVADPESVVLLELLGTTFAYIDGLFYQYTSQIENTFICVSSSPDLTLLFDTCGNLLLADPLLQAVFLQGEEYTSLVAQGLVPDPYEWLWPQGEDPIQGGQVAGEGDDEDEPLLGSNGNVMIGGAEGDPVVVYGDIVPGVDGSVSIQTGSQVLGDTTPRLEALELPPVEVPAVELAPALLHESSLPLVISPGVSGYEGLAISADAEVVLRGPATIVLGSLALAEGATLTFDTAAGDVELYVLETLRLEPDSLVETSSDARDLHVQVAAADSGALEPAVQLRAASQFYGTIYAPTARVVIGADFELFGGLAARVLDLEPGARMHLDSRGWDDMPPIISWRIVEMPMMLRRLLLDPYESLGITRWDIVELAQAHDLAGIALSLNYMDGNRVEQAYQGPELTFDWGQVAEVLTIQRTGGDRLPTVRELNLARHLAAIAAAEREAAASGG